MDLETIKNNIQSTHLKVETVPALKDRWSGYSIGFAVNGIYCNDIEVAVNYCKTILTNMEETTKKLAEEAEAEININFFNPD